MTHSPLTGKEKGAIKLALQILIHGTQAVMQNDDKKIAEAVEILMELL